MLNALDTYRSGQSICHFFRLFHDFLTMKLKMFSMFKDIKVLMEVFSTFFLMNVKFSQITTQRPNKKFSFSQYSFLFGYTLIGSIQSYLSHL